MWLPALGSGCCASSGLRASLSPAEALGSSRLATSVFFPSIYLTARVPGVTPCHSAGGEGGIRWPPCSGWGCGRIKGDSKGGPLWVSSPQGLPGRGDPGHRAKVLGWSVRPCRPLKAPALSAAIAVCPESRGAGYGGLSLAPGHPGSRWHGLAGGGACSLRTASPGVPEAPGSLGRAWTQGASVAGLRGPQGLPSWRASTQGREEAPGEGGGGGLTADGIDLPVERHTGVVRAGLQHGRHWLPGCLLEREAPSLRG